MFRSLLVLGVFTVAYAAPSYLYGGYGVPVATSYSSRIDYPSPVLGKTVVTTPIVSGYGLGYGSVYDGGYGGYGNGLVYGHGLGYGRGLGYDHEIGLGYGYEHIYN